MTTPRTLNIKTKPTNDPNLAGIKGITSLFIEKIAAVSAIGEMYSCNVRKVVRHLFLSLYLAIISLPS
jgi:hypothetical protein